MKFHKILGLAIISLGAFAMLWALAAGLSLRAETIVLDVGPTPHLVDADGAYDGDLLRVAGTATWYKIPDAERRPMTFEEEMEWALPMVQHRAQINTSGQIRGIWKGPGFNWDVQRWEPTNARKRQAPGNIAWPVIMGACDTLQECEDEMDDACVDAGHGGVDTTTVRIFNHPNGSSTCSGDCLQDGAIAFQICGPVQ